MNQQPITSLKGIGEKTAKLFSKLGVETVEELLHDYPRAYDAYEEPVPIGNLREKGVFAVSGQLMKTPSVRRFKNIQVIITDVRDMTGTLQLTWYNMAYLHNVLQMGQILVFRGRVVKKNGRLTMEQPEVFTPEQYRGVMHSMQPVYGQTKGLGNKAITRAVQQALLQRQMEREYLPEELRSRYELAEYNYAIEHIHFPADKKELLFARKRLVFDEFLFFLLSVRRLKEKRQDLKSRYIISRSSEVDRLLASLPYELTGAQKKVLEEVRKDLESGLVMNRLVQGDVGSGKTIVAVLALLETAMNGCQGAMMVPTEVLAKQHYESITELFETYGIEKQVVLVTGSMTAKEKRLAYEKIASHEADIIVGTHALIQEKVHYDRLALVITDEQHRFGVGQREALGNKGNETDPELTPHVLVMSATPIPRTLAIILYGDLDISIIDEMPAERLPIKNCVVDTGYRDKAYKFIAREVAAGRQAYVICPMVEESELIEAENVLDYTKILREKLPAGITVEYLHGKMKGKEKNQIMERFASGEIQVLVSTTVVEVGVNVPNATVMMIENAERFGLAQLHQLRGRVGRGAHQSYCIMVNCSDQDGTQERLNILNRSNDGFYIASEDLKLRGPGDFFGVRQSGDMEFKIADIFTDANLLKTVSEEVNRILKQDPNLESEEYQPLKERLDIYLSKSYDKLNL
ncbi:ATP-dependent DNA helicase RecG [Clostridium sp. OM02-18AC]|uniref:ATP-dependent DNA helicase RecG n=1 Tax=Clostridium sp. OM02-18AC TaxID=2292311 RepID=UPI000E4A7404|nr:ATP-dependent DNA helicase RecG [Clostridium sp. OM02-18AC]RHV63098.1 ATP-dependent DNA helicase RecG [Clostridium sp. OM02-18AC]